VGPRKSVSNRAPRLLTPAMGVQRGGKRSDGTGHPKQGGHPKSETPKIKMLWQDDFSYCKATHTCCMDLIFRDLCSLSGLVFMYSNASNSDIT